MIPFPNSQPFTQIRDALYNLVPFAQFKKREKPLRRSVTFQPSTLLKVTFLHRCFSRFLNCINGTKWRTPRPQTQPKKKKY